MKTDNKPTHTPGPWDYVEGKTLFHVERSGGQGPVCSIPKSREADARLVSAAPDLLAALKNIISEAENAHLIFNTRFSSEELAEVRGFMVKAYDAIAKAEGK